MAGRRRAKAKDCYVYRIFDKMETVYVGKGTRGRLAAQKRRFGCDGEILESDLTDDEAFGRERYWIAKLMPTSNVCAGGNGGRTASIPDCPVRGITDAEWRKAIKDMARTERDMAEIGPRRYVARYLCQKLDESNCEQYGVSKVGVFRLREVANGPWC